MKRIVTVCIAGFLAGAAIAFDEVLLNDFAVTNSSGEIVALGTPAANSDYALSKAFDGDTSTFYDGPGSAGTWVGLELQSPKIITKVSYTARSDTEFWGYGRMRRCLIQGANQSDFSDAVTLLTVNPPASWKGATYNTERVTNTVAMSTAFRYLRLVSPEAYDYVSGADNPQTACCGGNVSELDFYGNDIPENPTAPAVPTIDKKGTINSVANCRVVRSADALLYELMRKYEGEDSWTGLATVTGGVAGTAWIRGAASADRAADYKVRAYAPCATSDSAEWHCDVHHALIGTVNGYGNANTTYGYAKVFDGDMTTFYDSAKSISWSGMDFGEERTIVGLRYVRRPGGDGPRIRGALFQVANLEDYSDAVTFYTAPTDTTPPEYEIVEVTLDTPVSGRYARYHTPDSGYGNIAECEFDGTPHPVTAPTGLTVVRSDITNFYAKLEWQTSASDLVSSSVVWRATAENGPWTRIGEVPFATTTFTDNTLRTGVRYWYAMGYDRVENGEAHFGTLGTGVEYRRYMRLERDWSDLTTLRDGVTTIVSKDKWNWQQISNLFDGNASTFADIYNNDTKDIGSFGGVDFGSGRYSVGLVRVLPRQDNDGRNRAPNYQLFGGDSYTNLTENGVVPKMQFSGISWGTFASTNTLPYRYFWLNKPEGGGYMNIAELELYGWPEDILLAPEELAFEMAAEGVRLTWTGCKAAVRYRVERSADGGTVWSPLAQVTATAYTDAASVRDGSAVLYRVVAVDANGEEMAGGQLRVVSYAPGSGMGLSGVYTWPWRKDAYDEPQAVVTNTDACLAFDWGAGTLVSSVADATNNVYVAWRGTLSVPYAGSYAFTADADDFIHLRIDGTSVINRWGDDEAAVKGLISLDAGDHVIEVEYVEQSGNAKCVLSWGGAVADEVIPASQFKRLDPVDISPWEGNRTFNSTYNGEARVSGDTVTLHCMQGDLGGTANAYHFLWRRHRGDFDATMKVETDGVNCKVLLMARSSLDTTAPFIATATDGAPYKYGIKRRMTAGGYVYDTTPAWVDTGVSKGRMRLKREGNTFSCYWKSEGQATWTLINSYTFDDGIFGDEVFVGPATTRNNQSVTSLSLGWHTVSHFRLAPVGMVILLR